MTSDARIVPELWEIERIVPYEKNAKKHPSGQIEKLAASIQKFGWTQPIVVDRDGVIIAGHGRRLAAMKLGLAKVPVVCRRDLTPEEAGALRLADNRVASTEYDMTLVQAEIADLFATGFDLSLTGYDEKELSFLSTDLGDIDTSLFVDDVGDAVEAQKEANARRVEEIDMTAAPLADAFGFRRVTVAQSRAIRTFMTRIEAETGLKGAEALMVHIGAPR